MIPLNPASGSSDREGRVVPSDDVPTIVGKLPGATKTAAEGFSLAAGAQLAHFEVIAPLGAGGMASVFKARDLTLGREVALKILPPDFARDPDAVTRFKLEARAAAQLNHEHVARVFFTGEDGGLNFIAFEFVEGETLREAIDRLGTIPPADCVRYLLHIATGLRHASERGVVHRDVKPSNILITPDGRAKLIDMGLARSHNAVNGGVTQSGTTLGTFDYISPEQAIDPRTADVRSDIYSLGCTCYHALTGRPPVPEGNAARKLAAHQSELPVDPRLINPAVPDELAEVLDRMMAKKPEHRYQTAADLIDDLVRVARLIGLPLDGTDIYPLAESERRPVPEPVAKHGSSTAWFMGGSAVAIAVVVFLGVWSRSGPTPTPPWAEPPPPVAGVGVGAGAELVPGEPTPRLPAKSLAVANADELVKAVKAGVSKLILTPGVEYDLTGTDGVVASGKVIEWVCSAEPQAAVVRVAAVVSTERADDPRPGAVTFSRCESVRLSGLRFQIVHPLDDTLAEPVGLVFADVGRVEWWEAAFESGGEAAGTEGVGVSLNRVGGLTARHCFFGLKHGTAVELARTVTATFTECGFVTGRTAVEVSASPGTADRTAVTLKHTTFLLQAGAAGVVVNRDARCDLTAGFSVFAAPTADASTLMMTDPERNAVFVRGGEGAEYTVAAADDQPNAAYLVNWPTTSVGSPPEQLKTNPWVNARADTGQPWGVLELNPKVKALRTTVAGVGILGVRALPAERNKLYEVWPLPALYPPGVKVWHPNATAAEREDLPPHVFTELAQAVAALKKGDVLEIRGSGRIEVPTAVVLTDPKRAVVVRAEKGSAPVMVPAGEGRRDAVLFRLEAGELILDGLGFLLQPNGTDGTTAVVSVSGGRRCEVRNCVITLDEEADESAAAVAVSDVTEQMKSDTVVRPAIAFENCLVRGRGRLVRAGTTVPMDVTVTNVGAAVNGPLFEFGTPGHTSPGGGVSVQLTQLTAVLGGPLLDVRSARRSVDDKPLVVPVDVRADGCLFLPLESGTHPLVHLVGSDPSGPERPLAWTAGATGNGFSGWDVYAEAPNAENAGELKRWDALDWRRWSGERDTAIGRAALAKTPTAKGLLTVQPSDLEPSINPFSSGVGVKVKLLPKADEESNPGPVTR